MSMSASGTTSFGSSAATAAAAGAPDAAGAGPAGTAVRSFEMSCPVKALANRDGQ
jgi:hypothetical protein